MQKGMSSFEEPWVYTWYISRRYRGLAVLRQSGSFWRLWLVYYICFLRTVIVPVDMHDCETRSLSVREEHEL